MQGRKTRWIFCSKVFHRYLFLRQASKVNIHLIKTNSTVRTMCADCSVNATYKVLLDLSKFVCLQQIALLIVRFDDVHTICKVSDVYH